MDVYAGSRSPFNTGPKAFFHSEGDPLPAAKCAGATYVKSHFETSSTHRCSSGRTLSLLYTSVSVTGATRQAPGSFAKDACGSTIDEAKARRRGTGARCAPSRVATNHPRLARPSTDPQ